MVMAGRRPFNEEERTNEVAMSVPSDCPDVWILQQLALGEMSPAEVEILARHCEECPRCVQTLHSLTVGDTLIEAMAAQRTKRDQARDASVNNLIERLKSLPPPEEMPPTLCGGDPPPGDTAAGEFLLNTPAEGLIFAPPRGPDEIGRLGGYRILKMLGAGGMGMVYKAEDVQLQRPIALKIMKAEVAKHPDNRERFLREARAAAKLKSDYVVTIHQVGQERNIVFLAMEFLEGMSLADWLSKGRKTTLAQAARLGRQIALGLADAHACGLIHRDIKPGNIWLDSRQQGRVKLLDFGLARGHKEDIQLTLSGTILGTPAFMAPEQARGERVDPRADLFSLGVVLYRLTTGQMPFRGDNAMALLTSLALETPTPPCQINPDIPPRMAALLESLLAKDREQRPATARAVAEELALLSREERQSAEEEPTVRTALRQRPLPSEPSTREEVHPEGETLPRQWTLPLRRWLVAASLLLLVGGGAAALVVHVRDKQGKDIAKVSVPEGGSVEISDDGEGKAEASRPRPLPPLLSGEPLAPAALVRQPAKLPGVRSWTIEPRFSRAKGEKENSHPFSFRLAPDGQTVATLLSQHAVLSSLDTGQVVAVLKEATGDLAWSPDGKSIATGGAAGDSRVLLWDSTGRLQSRLSDPTILGPAASLAWAPDGKRLAAAFQSTKEVFVWDTEKGTRLPTLGSFPEVPDKLSWSPAGVLAFWIHNTGWHFWNVEKNKLVNDPKQWNWPLLHVTPDGSAALVRLSNDMAYRVRDLATGKILAGPLMTGAWVDPPMAWSPSGELLARVRDANVELWRVSGNRHVRTLRSTQPVEQVAFTADGKQVAGRTGERLHIWETDTGRLRGILLLGEKNNGLTITADGYYTGNEQVERGIVLAVQKDDGTQEVLEPADFEQKYGWKNEPDKVHLLQPLLPPLYPQPSMPMAANALVREPIELSHANSWTIETINARGPVKALAYCPDGKLLATGGDDGTIRLWDTRSGKLIRMLVGDPVESLSWSKDGTMLASVAFMRGVSLWETDTGRLLRHLKGGGRFVAWSPDGRSLAVLHDHALLQLWDKVTERVVREHSFSGRGLGLAWSPDGKTIAVGLDDKSLRLWDVTEWKERHKFAGHTSEWVRGIAWSPDSKRVVSAADGEPNFCVCDAATGKQARFAIDAGIAPSAAIAWAPDGNGVVIGSLGLFDPDNGRCIRSYDIDPHVTVIAVSPDGKQIARAGSAGSYLLDAATGKRTHTLAESPGDGPLYVSAWSPEGRSLALAINSAPEPSLRIIEAATGRRLPLAGPEYIRAGAWSPDGETFAAIGRDANVYLLDANSSRVLRRLEGPIDSSTALAWSADGKRLAGGGWGSIHVWTVESGKQVWSKDERSVALAWSPDGRRLAATDNTDKGAMRIWDAENGKLLHEYPLSAEGGLAWSSHGKTIAALPMNGPEGLLIDAESGSVRLRLKDGAIGTCSVRWPSDGKSFTTLSNQGQLRAWDAADGKARPALQLPGAQSRINSAAWSPDSRVLAWSNHVEIHLHDAAGQPLGVLLPFDAFGQLAITADGHYRGNARVERLIRMVVQKRDGTTQTLTPHEFEQQYGFKNEPTQVKLIEK